WRLLKSADHCTSHRAAGARSRTLGTSTRTDAPGQARDTTGGECGRVMRFPQHRVGEFLEDFRTLVECEAPSSDPQALTASARLVAEAGQRITGIRPSISTIEGFPHVLFHIGTGPRRVLLVG